MEAISIIGNGKHIGENLALLAENEAVVLVLCYIDSNANHDDTSKMMIYDAASTEHFAL